MDQATKLAIGVEEEKPPATATEKVDDGRVEQQQQQQQKQQQQELSQNGKPTKLCQGCQQNVALYVCPACSYRTCSLACCLLHKKRYNCTGKRNRTAYMPLSRMNDGQIVSDYHFLEDMLGKVDASQRYRKDKKVGSHSAYGNNKKKRPREQISKTEPNINQNILLTVDPSHPAPATATAAAAAAAASGSAILPRYQQQRMHPKWEYFQQQAAARCIRLLFMPEKMARHLSNRSYINKRSNIMHWTVEWCVHLDDDDDNSDTLEGTIVNLPDKHHDRKKEKAGIIRKVSQVSEQDFLKDAVSKLFSNNSEEIGDKKLAKMLPSVGTYSLLMKRLPCPSNCPKYTLLSREMTFAAVLKNSTVIEYPTIDIVPTSREDEFPRLIQEVT